MTASSPASRSVRPKRVVQWTSGIVGGAALRNLIDDPRFELVGLYTHSEAKVGQDAGEIAGRPTTGVLATSSVDEVIALRPDCIVYMPQWIDGDELTGLLEAGINVVTTARLVTGRHYPDALGQRLQDAAVSGGATLLGTGMNPMLVPTVALAATGMCSQVRGITVHESVDCAMYGSSGTWEAYGFGSAPDTDRIRAELLEAEPDYYEALDELASGIGVDLDGYDLQLELATADADRDLGFMKLPAGTVSALDARWIGLVGGEACVELRTTWKLGAMFGHSDTPDWPLFYGYRVSIEGEPNVTVKLGFVPSDLENIDIGEGTAMPALNAIHAVCDAAPGVTSVVELPLITSHRR